MPTTSDPTDADVPATQTAVEDHSVPAVDGGSQPPRRTTPLAIWCLVLALAPIPLGLAMEGVSSPAPIAVAGLLVLASWAGSVVMGIVAIKRVRRSGGLLRGITLSIAGMVWIALSVVLGVASMASSDEVLLRDDFEGERNFSTDEDRFVSLRYANGGYEFLIKDPATPHHARFFIDEPAQQAISFAAEATILEGPEEDIAIGLGCFPSANYGYVIAIQPSGHYFVLEEIRDRAPQLLTEGRSAPLRGIGVVNEISMTCRGGGSDPTTLALTANGKEVVLYEDPGGYDSFVAVGFYVNTLQAGTLVRFDNALAERA